MTIAEKIRNRFNTQPVIVYRDLAGSGKSKAVGEFAQLVGVEGEKVAFGTNTRKGRDDFVTNNPYFVAIKGITEIIEEEAGEDIAKKYSSLFETDPDNKDKLYSLVEKGELSTVKYNNIKREKSYYQDLLNKSQFVALTVAKIQVGDFVKHLYGRYVFLDEMRQDRVWTAKEAYRVYQSDHEAEEDETVNKFTAALLRATHSRLKQQGDYYEIEPQKIKGICFLSAEKSLQRIFESETIPPFKRGKYDLSNDEILHDNDLSIIYVRSTSNNKDRSKRDELAQVVRKAGYKVICDGKLKTKDRNNQKIGDFTIEESKGRNSMKELNLCTIISHPAGEEIVNTMAAFGVPYIDTSDALKLSDIYAYEMNVRDLQLYINEAVKVIISDKANQSIGRNTGHRNIELAYKHVLIVPEKLKPLLELDISTDNEYTLTKRSDVESLPQSLQAAFGELFNSKEHLITDQVQHVLKTLQSAPSIAIEVKRVKRTTKERLLKSGVSQRQIDHEKIVSGVIAELKKQGVNQREIKRKQALYLASAQLDTLWTDKGDFIDL